MGHALIKLQSATALWEVLKVNVYDRKLKLIYSGQFTEGQEPQVEKLLKDCSLLFDVRNTSYYLRNH